jgi:hypothetical protein
MRASFIKLGTPDIQVQTDYLESFLFCFLSVCLVSLKQILTYSSYDEFYLSCQLHSVP